MQKGVTLVWILKRYYIILLYYNAIDHLLEWLNYITSATSKFQINHHYFETKGKKKNSQFIPTIKKCICLCIVYSRNKKYKLIRFIYCELNFENGSEITEKNVDLKGNDFSWTILQ